MNTIKTNSPTRLKICCSFSDFMKGEKITSELERNLTEMLWTYLEKNKQLCSNCK